MVQTWAENKDIDTTQVHSAKELFRKIRKYSYLQDEMKFLHQIFKGQLPNATWIHANQKEFARKVQGQNHVNVIKS